jgi:CRP/FNR family cyclic AMP-dependent transcriptional regulator
MVDRMPLGFNPTTFFAKMRGGVTTVNRRKDEVFYVQGDVADSVFYIDSGRAKVSVLSAQGKEAVVAILSGGQFFGEGCIAGQLVRMASVAAMTDCVAIRIEKDAMIRLIHDEPEVSEIFVRHLLARNIRVESDLVDQLFNSSEKRLARMLLLLANFGKEGRPETILAPISQTTLAEMIGTTRSRVSFFMNKFRQLGFIEYNGHLKVHSSLLSVVLNDSSDHNRSEDEPPDSDTKPEM